MNKEIDINKELEKIFENKDNNFKNKKNSVKYNVCEEKTYRGGFVNTKEYKGRKEYHKNFERGDSNKVRTKILGIRLTEEEYKEITSYIKDNKFKTYEYFLKLYYDDRYL